MAKKNYGPFFYVLQSDRVVAKWGDKKRARATAEGQLAAGGKEVIVLRVTQVTTLSGEDLSASLPKDVF